MKRLFKPVRFYIGYAVALLLISILLLVLGRTFGDQVRQIGAFLFFVTIIITFNIYTRVQRKQAFQRIEGLRKALDLPIAEARQLAGIGRYDLIDWQWEQAVITPKQLSTLTTALELRYVQQYGKPFH
jgi:cytochrome c biogenesis protein CcdA